MDKETRDAFANIAGALALIARQQTVQGEVLGRIVGLLSPEPSEDDGPTLDERMVQLLNTIEAANTVTTAYLKSLGKAVDEVPVKTAKAIYDNIGPVTKEDFGG